MMRPITLSLVLHSSHLIFPACTFLNSCANQSMLVHRHSHRTRSRRITTRHVHHCMPIPLHIPHLVMNHVSFRLSLCSNSNSSSAPSCLSPFSYLSLLPSSDAVLRCVDVTPGSDAFDLFAHIVPCYSHDDKVAVLLVPLSKSYLEYVRSIIESIINCVLGTLSHSVVTFWGHFLTPTVS